MLSLRLLAAASVLVAPTAAHAESQVTEHAVADAQSTRTDADEELFTSAPEHMAADITRTVAARAPRRGAHPVPAFAIQTSRNAPEAGTGLTRGLRVHVVHGRGFSFVGGRCRDQLTVSVPTASLGSPAWMRVGVPSVVTEVDSLRDEPYSLYLDDAHMAAASRTAACAWGRRSSAGDRTASARPAAPRALIRAAALSRISYDAHRSLVARPGEAGCSRDALSRPMARDPRLRRLGRERRLRRGLPGRGIAARGPQLRAGPRSSLYGEASRSWLPPGRTCEYDLRGLGVDYPGTFVTFSPSPLRLVFVAMAIAGVPLLRYLSRMLRRSASVVV